jgi:DNA topoisomerase VI subunit B
MGAKAAQPTKDTFERKTFTTSRLAEFATETELTKQIGHSAALWPIVVVKELVDNALDAAERAGIAPEVSVNVEANSIVVADNGPGIAAATVKRLINFDAKTSSNAAYVAPTRGQQGNALQSILPMGFVLDGAAGAVTIEAHGRAHHIEFTVDSVRRTPTVVIRSDPSAVKKGTRVTVCWPNSPGLSLANAENIFLRLVTRYGWFNPHLTIEALWFGGEDAGWSVTNPTWTKWKPNSSTSPHWYNSERLRLLMAAEIAHAEDNRKPSPSVREFVQQFRGLSSTVKASVICAQLGVGERETLADYYRRAPGGLDLLAAMQAFSATVKPAALGVIGKEHLEAMLDAYGCAAGSVVYRKVEFKGETDSLPYVIEVAFGYRDKDDKRGMQLVEGFNFTPAIGGSPFELAARLAGALIEDEDPVIVFAHVVCPRLKFVDRGKSHVNLPIAASAKLNVMVDAVTAKWTKQKRAEIREANAHWRRYDVMVKQDKPTTIKHAAYIVMGDAYAKASASGTLPANPRQIMYAARPAILAATGKDRLDDKYFTQTLLPDFMTDNPELTASWDIAWDDRGHFSEPHTGISIGLGTLAVREYLGEISEPEIGEVEISTPHVRTKGPKGRFGAVLYIEKEGFLPILAAAQTAERYDLALASSKGMSVTACRSLVEELCGRRGLPLFVLHDFDGSGFSIKQTLVTSNRRYTFEHAINYVDMGLRLDAVDGLDDEPVALKDKDAVAYRLRINGATEAEIEFLLEGPEGVGRRVELNAMTSDQFIAFVERKLEEHGVAKVVPNTDLLAETYTAFRRSALATSALRAELARLNASLVDVPTDLERQVRAYLADQPAAAWDDAVLAIVGNSPR